jgi:hypothetical protein
MNRPTLTRLLADPHSDRSLSSLARSRRWSEFERRFPDLQEMSVLDLGGTASYWRSSPRRPASLTLLNLFEQEPPWADGAGALVGDVCDPPAQLRGERFDLVVSNSVIGHIGGHEMRSRFADVVLALGDSHWVQTPNRHFPLDPIFLFPAFPSLPFSAQVAVSRHWPLGHRQAETREAAAGLVLGVEFLTAAQLAHYFPGSELWRERFLGMTKSLVAIGNGASHRRTG